MGVYNINKKIIYLNNNLLSSLKSVSSESTAMHVS